MAYFLGIDTSTTATKALLIDSAGQVAGTASDSYTYQTPRPQWSEGEPERWWLAARRAIRKVLEASGVDPVEVRGVGLTGQMHGMVALDEAGEVLRPAILWNDQRTGAECDQIREQIGKERFIQITGNDALPGFTAPKILWVKNHQPEIFRKIRHILLPKDYLRCCLTGQYAADKAGAAGTALFDLAKRDWSEEVITALGMDPGWFPPTFEGPDAAGAVSKSAAAATGLPEGIPVAAGGGDQAAAAVGMGAVIPGVVSLTLGTSGVVFASTPEPWIDPEGRLHAFCHALPDTWHLMGVMLSAAGSLRWYRDVFFPETSFEALVDGASQVPPGSEGLFFVPYLTGERTPHPDPLASGAFLGLSVRHTAAHLTRSVLEGVAFGLKDSLELIGKAGLQQVQQIRISGGGSQSALWRQIIADVLGVELVTVNTSEGSAFGAALLAAVGCGEFSSVPEACAAVIDVEGLTAPGPDSARYQENYQTYRGLYPLLRPFYQRSIP